MAEPFLDQAPNQPTVRGFLHRAEDHADAGLVLTHSAGGNCNSPLLVGLAEALCKAGLTVLRCDLPFRQSRPHGPPLGSAEKDQAGLHRAVQVLREQLKGRIFLGGHSYGGRMATMLCAREPSLVDGLLLLSYPLHPPRKPDQLRTAHFRKLQTRALFVHGTRDPFGSIEEMNSGLTLIPEETKLLSVEGVGHELLPKKKSDSFLTLVVERFAQFFE
jgi:predicted alpha/beta-hydrolase family hydrolase